MPNSLRCKIKNLCHKGILNEKDRDRLIHGLDCADALPEIRKKVEDFRNLKCKSSDVLGLIDKHLPGTGEIYPDEFESLECLTERPCEACKYHSDSGCSVWSCVFDDQQESEDMISRQAVDTLVDELARAISDERCFISRGRSIATIMQDILDLPSVNPQKNIVNNGTMNITL